MKWKCFVLNKSESKYFNTAIKMDEALLCLLERKDFEYITIKEICQKAQVNRSTFYLHYQNTSELLEETIEYINKKFLSFFAINEDDIAEKIQNGLIEDLIFVTSTYLTPYLTFIKEYQRIFKAAIKQPSVMCSEEIYKNMFCNIFNPIMERMGFPVSERTYIIAFYINGIVAIIQEWLKSNCQDSIDNITNIIIKCTNTFNYKDISI